jgi:hypothetical protein
MTPTISIRIISVALWVVIIATAVSAQTRSVSWMRGTWEGTGYQTDDKSTWTMVLKVQGRKFSIDYPSLSCGGQWRLISVSASRARFRERLDHGQDKCADRGIVTLQRLNRKQVIYWWSYQGDTVVKASAVLNRKLTQ